MGTVEEKTNIMSILKELITKKEVTILIEA